MSFLRSIGNHALTIISRERPVPDRAISIGVTFLAYKYAPPISQPLTPHGDCGSTYRKVG